MYSTEVLKNSSHMDIEGVQVSKCANFEKEDFNMNAFLCKTLYFASACHLVQCRETKSVFAIICVYVIQQRAHSFCK